MNTQTVKSTSRSRWLTFPLALALVACGGGSRSASQTDNLDSTAVRSLEVSSSNTSVPAGTQLTYQALAHLANGSTIDVTDAATWSSSNALLVRFLGSTPGALATVGIGDTNITATYSGIDASAPLSITPAIVLSMSVSPSTPALAVGAAQPLVAFATLSSSTEDVTRVSQWTSSVPGVASVDANGVVTGVAAGSATISASYSGAVVTASVNVGYAADSNAPTTSNSGSTVDPGSTSTSGSTDSGSTSNSGSTVDPGSTSTSGSTADSGSTSTSGSPADSGSTSNSGSTVDSGSTSTSGSTSGSGGTSGGNGSCPGTTHTLISIVVSTVSSDTSAASGYTEQFSAMGYYADCTQADITGQVSWSSDTGVIVIDPATGLAVAVSTGVTNVRASLDGITSDPYSFVVTGAVLTGIDIVLGVNPGDNGYAQQPYTTIARGTSAFYTAWATFSDGSQLDVTSEMAWSSSAPDAISFTAPGAALGVQPVANASIFAELRSDSTITCPAGLTCSDSIPGGLTVTDATLVSLTVTSIDGTATLATLPPAPYSQQFIAIGTFSDGTTQDLTLDPNLAWTILSGNGAYFVDGYPGLLVTGSATNASVTATFGGIVGTIAVVVTNAQLTGIVIDPAAATLPATVGMQLTAKAVYSDSSQYALSPLVVRWSSSNPSVAQVSSSGYVTALTLGSASITAQLPGYTGISATSTITVVKGTLKSVTIVGNRVDTVQLPDFTVSVVGQRATVYATGLYDIGTGSLVAYDITKQCAWKSSARSVAAVQKTRSGAIITGLDPGSATISARRGSPKPTNPNMDTVGVTVGN